jgi:hypothetical protein
MRELDEVRPATITPILCVAESWAEFCFTVEQQEESERIMVDCISAAEAGAGGR